MTSTTTEGEVLLRALVAGDLDGAAAALAPEVDFRGLVPKKLREGSGREAVMEILRDWFPPGQVEELEALETDSIGGRHRVGYRVRWRDDDGSLLRFEQQAFYDVGPDGIEWMRLVCSGDRPVTT